MSKYGDASKQLLSHHWHTQPFLAVSLLSHTNICGARGKFLAQRISFHSPTAFEPSMSSFSKLFQKRLLAPPTAADRPGYIYMYFIPSNMPGYYLVKVGRTNNPLRRKLEWARQCRGQWQRWVPEVVRTRYAHKSGMNVSFIWIKSDNPQSVLFIWRYPQWDALGYDFSVTIESTEDIDLIYTNFFSGHRRHCEVFAVPIQPNIIKFLIELIRSLVV